MHRGKGSLRSWLAVSLVTTAVGCGGAEAPAAAGPGGPGGRGPTSFPVEVQPVRSQKVEYTVNAVGSVEAFEQIEVTSRVAGAVERVRFVEGQSVRKGDVLVEIEPERYRLTVQSAQANYEKAQASLNEAQAGLRRREQASANNPGLIPAEEVETWRTRTRTAAAQVAEARAALEQAKLSLRDAFVSAPAGGIIQTRTVQTGQYVQPGTVLATLVRRDPLLIRFQVPEQESARIRRGMTVRFTVTEAASDLTARITHVAESASTSSRMVVVTATVDDPRRGSLKPGAFARVTIPIGTATAAPVVPQTAIRPSEKGFLAFVVENETAKERVLQLGMRTPAGDVEVRSGLSPGELLVVRGAEALQDGAAVKVTRSEEPMTIRPLTTP